MIVRLVIIDLAILAFMFKLSQYKGIPVVLIWVAVVMGVDANYQKVVKGLVLLAAVIFDIVSKKKKG
ncbi:MAG: hypothetical protein ILP16_03180 [Spirochaetales bacterium]|nr:hypothetical protein [Spirochaetales bacterium]